MAQFTLTSIPHSVPALQVLCPCQYRSPRVVVAHHPESPLLCNHFSSTLAPNCCPLSPAGTFLFQTLALTTQVSILRPAPEPALLFVAWAWGAPCGSREACPPSRGSVLLTP